MANIISLNIAISALFRWKLAPQAYAQLLVITRSDIYSKYPKLMQISKGLRDRARIKIR